MQAVSSVALAVHVSWPHHKQGIEGMTSMRATVARHAVSFMFDTEPCPSLPGFSSETWHSTFQTMDEIGDKAAALPEGSPC